MTFPIEYISLIDYFLLIVAFIAIILGAKQGLVKSLIDLFGFAVAFVVAYLLSSPLAKSLDFTKNLVIFDLGIEALNILLKDLCNRAICFLIVFAVCIVLVIVIKYLVLKIKELPVFKQIDMILGALFGLLKVYIVGLALVLFFSTPILNNGQIVIERTMLKDISSQTAKVWKEFEVNQQINNLLCDLINGNGIFDDNEDAIEALKKYVDEETIEELIENYKK